MTQSTFKKTKEALEETKWFVFDATDKILGRFASEIVKILRGKHKPSYTPHIDTGDGVIITNASKVKVTGNKEAQKIYHHYSGHIGGLKEIPYRVMMKKNPENILLEAIKGMMPKTKLGKKQLKKLRIFVDDKHQQAAQKPIDVK